MKSAIFPVRHAVIKICLRNFKQLYWICFTRTYSIYNTLYIGLYDRVYIWISPYWKAVLCEDRNIWKYFAFCIQSIKINLKPNVPAYQQMQSTMINAAHKIENFPSPAAPRSSSTHCIHLPRLAEEQYRRTSTRGSENSHKSSFIISQEQ